MTTFNKMNPVLFFLFASIFLVECKKQDDYLNVKRQISDVVPTTLTDFQSILDNADGMNYKFPTIGYVGMDNIYLTDVNLNSMDQVSRAAYIWQKDIYQNITNAGFNSDWDDPYSVIEAANICLDGLSKISLSNDNQLLYNNVKGSALFFRSFLFYSLAQLYCKPYDSLTAGSDLGIVLRLTSDVNAKSTRATVKQTFDQMITDLKEAVTLLPATPSAQMRPSKISANALLAKIYLLTGDYENAKAYSTASLNIFNTLLDYNSGIITPTSSLPFPAYPQNPEISFYAFAQSGVGGYYSASAVNVANIDTVLYNSYDSLDLRKQLFFDHEGPDNSFFKGTYSGTYYAFNGIATDEVYLIRSEANARLGNYVEALNDLNTLLVKRFKTGFFVPIVYSSPDQLLSKILLERRKELIMTGQIRWEDLRRLNKDTRFAVTLTRVVKGVTYTLPPNDPRYVLPLPNMEIQLSGLTQNQR